MEGMILGAPNGMPPVLTRPAIPDGPVAIVSGSGLCLDGLLDSESRRIPFHQVSGMRDSTVPGHASCFIFGTCAGREVIIQSGRLHLYEGLSFEEVTRPAHALHEFGSRLIVCTNAVGALEARLAPGSLVGACSVHAWPFTPCSLPHDARPDYTVPGCDAYGEYWWMHGPCYETRAEVAALQRLGALCVGMSVAPEIAACRRLGIKTAVVSCVTNNCVTEEHVSHERVVATARASAVRLAGILRRMLET